MVFISALGVFVLFWQVKDRILFATPEQPKGAYNQLQEAVSVKEE